jgi:ABC-type proline/glycine betaine transport system permease subunit
MLHIAAARAGNARLRSILRTDAIDGLEKGVQILVLAVAVKRVEHIGLVGFRQDLHRQ